MYSTVLLDHFQNPRNVGTLESPAESVTIENQICGDIMILFAEYTDGSIQQIRYQVRGCTASIAAGSVLTEMVQGCTIQELQAITPEQVETALDGLPTESRHAARLACEAAQALGKHLTAIQSDPG